MQSDEFVYGLIASAEKLPLDPGAGDAIPDFGGSFTSQPPSACSVIRQQVEASDTSTEMCYPTSAPVVQSPNGRRMAVPGGALMRLPMMSNPEV